MTTVAGTGVQGAASGPALSAQFNGLGGIAVDAGGNVYIADSQGIRRLANGQVESFLPAGAELPHSGAMAIDGAGNVYVADRGAGVIREISPQGTLLSLGSGIAPALDPTAIAADGAGNIYLAESNFDVRKLTPSGTVSLVVSATGWVEQNFVPQAIAVDSQGNVFVASARSIEKVSPQGSISLLAGSLGAINQPNADGPGTTATFASISALAYQGGWLYVADHHCLRVVGFDGAVTTIAGQPQDSLGFADGLGGNAHFSEIGGISLDPAGNVYLTDYYNQRIREASPSKSRSVPFVNNVSISPGNSLGLNQSVQLSTVAYGPGTVSFQWYKDGNPIPGADSANYSIAHAQASDAGTYWVAASNEAGTTISGKNSLFIYSPPSTAFTAAHTLAGGTSLWGIAAGNQMYVAVGTGGGILTSADGVHWQHVNSGVSVWLVAVCFANGQFVAVGEQGTILLSPDGAHWTAVTAPTSQRLNNVAYAAGTYVIVGEGGTILTSPDARNWTQRASGVSGWLRGIAFESPPTMSYSPPASHWIVTGQKGTILESVDGTKWTSRSAWLFVAPYGNVGSDLEAIGGLSSSWVVAVGAGGDVVSGSYGPPYGAKGAVVGVWNWSGSIVPVSNARLRGLATAHGGMYAFGENGTLLAASGSSGPYATLSSGTASNLNGGTAIGNRVFIVGDDETILESAPVPASRLLNLSSLSVTTGGAPIIAGFVISGPGEKSMLVRGIGPTLSDFGVPGPIADPLLTLYDGQQQAMSSNQGWSLQSGAADVAHLSQVLGAFPLPSGSADASMIAHLGAGLYTAHVVSASGGTGPGLIELYDGDPDSNSAATLVNISTSARVAPGSIITSGFVIGGVGSHRLLIRGVGPGLLAYGISLPLAHPRLTVFDQASRPIATADAWSQQPNAAAIATDASVSGAFALDPASTDAALEAYLPPGSYTVQVSSGDGSSGTALLEIYDLP